jgi:predicted membrane-bound mannosyltransferase
VAAGACFGLAQATKASAPLFIVVGLLALWVAREGRPGTRRVGRDAAFALVAAVGTAAALYASFGTNPAGLRDAVGVYTHAIARFGAESAPTGHEKPWWYYLRIFGWHREGGLLWHQAVFSALACSGAVIALIRREPFLRGAALYALAVTALFSLFAYKTPWHTVHFVPGCAILAAATLAAVARLRTGRPVAVAFALIAGATLFQQTWRSSFLRPADQRNPYAYVHSSPDVLKYRALAEGAQHDAPGQPIRVIGEEYWPLPWYLRGLPHVGYYSTPPAECDGALIIAAAAQADAVRTNLRHTYRESLLGLRPGVLCVVFTRDDGHADTRQQPPLRP